MEQFRYKAYLVSKLEWWQQGPQIIGFTLKLFLLHMLPTQFTIDVFSSDVFYTHTITHAYTCVYKYIYMYTYKCFCTHIYIHIQCIHTNMHILHTHVCIYTLIHMYVYLSVHMYVYICKNVECLIIFTFVLLIKLLQQHCAFCFYMHNTICLIHAYLYISLYILTESWQGDVF